MNPVNYVELLAGIPEGHWVALSKDRTKILGKGPTYNDAEREAARNSREEPVMLKVNKTLMF